MPRDMGKATYSLISVAHLGRHVYWAQKMKNHIITFNHPDKPFHGWRFVGTWPAHHLLLSSEATIGTRIACKDSKAKEGT